MSLRGHFLLSAHPRSLKGGNTISVPRTAEILRPSVFAGHVQHNGQIAWAVSALTFYLETGSGPCQSQDPYAHTAGCNVDKPHISAYTEHRVDDLSVQYRYQPPAPQ